MGREIVYCEICGERILEQEFEKGRAITLLNKNYCSKCKEEAIRNVFIDDVPVVPQPAPSVPAPAPHASAPHPAPHLGPPRPSKPPFRSQAPTSLRLPPPRRVEKKRSLAGGIVAGILVVGALAAGVVAFLTLGEPQAPGPSEPRTTEPTPPPPPKPPGPRVDTPMEIFGKIKALREGKAEPRKILEACAGARDVLAGTPYMADLNDIENEARRTALENLMEQFRKIVSTDEQFLRHEEAMKLIAQTREFSEAIPGESVKIDEVRRAYEKSYEAAAEAQFHAVAAEADALVKDKKFAEAAELIQNRFPPQFRNASWWLKLEYRLNMYNEILRFDSGESMPSRPVPAAGQWTTVFDGKQTELWYRLMQSGEKAGSWRVENGVLVGESSLPEEPGPPKGVHDFLVLKYPNIEDFELEWEMKSEGSGGLVGARLIPKTGYYAFGVMGREWSSCQMKFKGGDVRVWVSGLGYWATAHGKPGPGFLFFSINPGGKTYIRNVKLLRVK